MTCSTVTEEEYRFEERAAICEFDGGAERGEAEKWARYETARVMQRMRREGFVEREME